MFWYYKFHTITDMWVRKRENYRKSDSEVMLTSVLGDLLIKPLKVAIGVARHIIIGHEWRISRGSDK